MVSRVRCTPKASRGCSGGVAAEIIASRGAVRMPLPIRSAEITAEMAASPVLNSRKKRATADSP